MIAVPAPSVDVQLVSSPLGTTSLIAGSPLNITCSVAISPNVDTNFTVEVEWTRNGVPPSGPPRVTSVPVTETTPNHYQTTLVFTSLNKLFLVIFLHILREFRSSSSVLITASK